MKVSRKYGTGRSNSCCKTSHSSVCWCWHLGQSPKGDNDGCGRSGNCNGFHRRHHSDRPVLPNLQYDNARWRAWLSGGKATIGGRVSGGKRNRNVERYPPVLVPQAGYQFIDLVTGLGMGAGSQVSVDGGCGGGGMSQIALDDPQVDARFQQVGGVGMAQSM